MKHPSVLHAVFLATALATGSTLGAGEEKPVKHFMHSEGGNVDLDGMEYTTADKLQAAVIALPQGSRIQLNTGCMGAREIEVSPSIKVADFKTFCAAHGVKFTISAGLRF